MKKMLVVLILLPLLFSCGEESADSARLDTVLALTADVEAGKSSYDTNCASCHGAVGEGTSLGPEIKSQNNPRSVLDVVLVGADTMRSYAELSDQELANITAYSKSL